MRWLIGLAVFALLLVGADAAVRSYAENHIEARLARELDSRPDVSLGGFPITLRLLSGRVPAVDLEATDVRRGGLQIRKVILHLDGVRMSIGGSSAKVERGKGFAEIDLVELAAYIERRTPVVFLGFSDHLLNFKIGGRGVSVPLRLEGGDLVLRAPRIDDVTVPLPRVLGGIEYQTISDRGDFARLTFSFQDATLRSI